MSNSTNILGIGTARPAFSYDQEQLSDVYQQALLKSGADTNEEDIQAASHIQIPG